MKQLSRIFLLFVLTLSTLIANAQSLKFSGSWSGKLNVKGSELTLVLNVSCKGDSVFSTLDSPDQGVRGIPVQSTIVTDIGMFLSVPRIRAEYKAKLAGDTMLVGNWSQGGMTFPLNLVRLSVSFSVNRPQEPKPPFLYKSEEVEFESKAPGIKLAGTLTLPEGNGPFKAVVLVSGSGPQNRDEGLMMHKPFLVLSDFLTRQGIAVLRYDDRGIGKSGGVFSGSTTFDFADDAEGAVSYLLKRREIDSEKIGVIGHSEGGIIAPLVASRNKKVSFIVLLAAPGQKTTDMLNDQIRLTGIASGAAIDQLDESLALNRMLFATLIECPDDSLAAVRMTAIAKEQIGKWTSFSEADKKKQLKEFPVMLRQVINPWFRTFISWDPSENLQKTTCPVLAVNGTTDLQVPADKNLPIVEAALKKGGNNQVTVIRAEGLNHLFQHSVSGNPTEYGSIEETFSEEVMKQIAGWINR
ncbi:MAG: alpha/beta hydrolase [Bacteroidetes bacterium HGW-Bacteroidetes-22]|nr:MAG: alpha/beta hydrolase [Bacteroidetes bacterium HGW-Bacteroidetes-22]